MTEMRRVCQNCNTEYRHYPITAVGADRNEERAFIIVCSWACLARELQRLQLVA